MLAGIAYKIASTFVFACMMAIVKGLSHYPVGELVAFRSFFALIVLVIWLAQRGEFPQALRTRRVGGHLLRSLAGTGSMALNFGAFAFLPLADVTVVGYASPLIIVVLAAIWLGERVGPGRWFGVGLGFCGVVVMLWEHLGTGDQGLSRGAIGAGMSLAAAFCVAVAMIQTSRLVQSEHMGAVVFYFQFTAGCVGLLIMLVGALWPSSWPLASAMQGLAWVTPTGSALNMYHCSHSTVLIQPMMARWHLPSSETRFGVSLRVDFSMKGSSSEPCRTRSMETSSACASRQMVASVGLVSLRSIWLMMDLATPEWSDSSDRDMLCALRRRITARPNWPDSAKAPASRALALSLPSTPINSPALFAG